MAILKRHWPVAAAAAALLATAAVIYIVSLRQNQGRLVYALDDAYIHMDMARSLAGHGTWGITPHEFTSSSSSLLWTLLLAGVFHIWGASEMAPLMLNGLAALAVLGLAYWILRRHVPDRPVGIFVILTVLVFFTPLAPLIFSGMEHTLQVLLSLAFSYLAAVVLTRQPMPSTNSSAGHAWRVSLGEAGLAGLGALVTMIRYEGMFLVAVVCLLLLLRKRYALAGLTGFMAMLPIAVYAAYSMAQGWYAFPNSIILKAQTTNLYSLHGALEFLLSGSQDATLKIPRIFCLLGLGGIVWLFRSSKSAGLWRFHTVMIITLATTTLLHIQFAKVGWFYRYEAYLMAMFVLIAGLSVMEDLSSKKIVLNWALVRRHKILSLLVCGAMLPIAARGAFALEQTTMAMNDRYLEHIATARFVHDYYNDAVVVVNDIGAVAWYSDARLLDMFGLSSKEPVAFRRQAGGYTADDVRAWTAAKGAKIAILQTMWKEVAPRIPDEWVKVGQWEIPRNVVFGDTQVGFFAIDPREKDRLAACLGQFAGRVACNVRQSGLYTQRVLAQTN